MSGSPPGCAWDEAEAEARAVSMIDAREIADCADEAARWRLIHELSLHLLRGRLTGLGGLRVTFSCRPYGRDYKMEALFVRGRRG